MHLQGENDDIVALLSKVAPLSPPQPSQLLSTSPQDSDELAAAEGLLMLANPGALAPAAEVAFTVGCGSVTQPCSWK